VTGVLVFAGALVGAPLRYTVDRLVRRRFGPAFPVGTMAANLLACVVLGGITGVATAVPGPVTALVATGLCGALSTYSTLSYETILLVADAGYGRAAANIVVTTLAGTAALAGAAALVG
jgi:CrcB protein